MPIQGERRRRSLWGRWLWGHPGRLRLAETGQSLVEAAVSLPLLILVALGLVQFTLVVHAHQVVTGAAQDGARIAAAADATLEDGVDHARSLLRAGLGSSAELLVVPSTSGDAVVIETEARLRPIVPWVGDGPIRVAARGVVSKERFRV